MRKQVSVHKLMCVCVCACDELICMPQGERGGMGRSESGLNA